MYNFHLEERKDALIKLGEKVQCLPPEIFEEICHHVYACNSWFTKESVSAALENLKIYLQKPNFTNWITKYNFPKERVPKKVGVIMAGNIPLAGLHDFICVLVSGHKLYAKLSLKDSGLLQIIAQWLIEIAPNFKNYIHFVSKFIDIDAVIATGSNNSARYFNYYFSYLPHIFRKNKIGCAILKDNESVTDLESLAKDCLLYFGLGCRSIAKIFVPLDYNFTLLLEILKKQGKTSFKNHKYVNNYNYSKAIFSIEKIPHLDNGYILLTENKEFVSPIGVLYYEEYTSLKFIKQKLKQHSDKIQCIVSSDGYLENNLTFGKAQFPEIDNYADGIDTISFLLNLK